MEDLDNRGRLHNLWVRGLPETVDTEQLTATITGLFNNLIDRPVQTAIEMERILRTLRPKGRYIDPPRDVICCLVDYRLKEGILSKARNRIHLSHGGSDIHIYQDFSSITLQHRRDLKPLIVTLRAKGIHYRWKFPFDLSATNQGCTALLHVPEELQPFCDTLGIPVIDVPNWYPEFRRTTTRREPQREEPIDAQETRYRRRRSPSGNRSHASACGSHNGSSLTNSPRSRRVRRDY